MSVEDGPVDPAERIRVNHRRRACFLSAGGFNVTKSRRHRTTRDKLYVERKGKGANKHYIGSSLLQETAMHLEDPDHRTPLTLSGHHLGCVAEGKGPQTCKKRRLRNGG